MDDGSFCDIEMTLIKFDYQGQKFSADWVERGQKIFAQFSISMDSIQLIKIMIASNSN